MEYGVSIASTSVVRRMQEARRKKDNAQNASSEKLRAKSNNAKFSHVKSSLNTGKHLGNIKPKFDTSGEVFKRVKRQSLEQMLSRLDEKEESVDDLHQSDDASVITTVTLDEETKAVYDNCDFLLLDVRDPEEFEKCHIVGALNYPAIKLRRDQYLPELYTFKNKENKVMIVYDDDGYSKLGIDATTSFIQKLFNNVVLLSGGLIGMAERYPHRICGILPVAPSSPSQSRPSTAMSLKSNVSSMSNVSSAAKVKPPSSATGRRLPLGHGPR